MANRLSRFWFEKDEVVKEQQKKDLIEKHIPFYLKYLEKTITTNAAPEGWLFGKKVTYVDLKLGAYTEFMRKIDDKCLDSYPGILKLKESVDALPNIVKWIKERPQTDF